MNHIYPNWWRCDSTCNSLAPRNWQLQSKLVSLIFLSRHKFPIILLLSMAYFLFVKHFVTLVGSLQQLLVLIHIDYCLCSLYEQFKNPMLIHGPRLSSSLTLSAN